MKRHIVGLLGLSLIPFLAGWFTAKPSAEEVENCNIIWSTLLEVQNKPQHYKTIGTLKGSRSVPSIETRDLNLERSGRYGGSKNGISITLTKNRHASQPRVGEEFVRLVSYKYAHRKESYDSKLIELFKSTFPDVQKAEIEVTKQLEKERLLAREQKQKEREEKDHQEVCARKR